MYSEKSTNLYEKKKSRDYLINIFILQFVNNFLALLLCKIKVLSTFHTVDFFEVFIPSGSIQNSH